jgi:hypothetical protein
MRQTANSYPGIIHPDAIYRLDELLLRLQWGKHAWATAKRHGLRPCYAGGRAYVRGDAVIRHIESARRGKPEIDPAVLIELHGLISAATSGDQAIAKRHLVKLNDLAGVALEFADGASQGGSVAEMNANGGDV